MRRGDTKGTSQAWSSARLPMWNTLRKMAEAITHDRIKPKEKRRGSPNILLTDEQVIEARRLYEQGGMPYRAIADKFGVSHQYMYALVNYATRSKLFPK